VLALTLDLKPRATASTSPRLVGLGFVVSLMDTDVWTMAVGAVMRNERKRRHQLVPGVG